MNDQEIKIWNDAIQSCVDILYKSNDLGGHGIIHNCSSCGSDAELPDKFESLSDQYDWHNDIVWKCRDLMLKLKKEV